jgi:hypothetical protein
MLSNTLGSLGGCAVARLHAYKDEYIGSARDKCLKLRAGVVMIDKRQQDADAGTLW